MKSIVIIFTLLITSVASILSAETSDEAPLLDLTSNPILMQTVACSTGSDECRVFAYNEPKNAMQSFGFALLPATATEPFESYEGKTFAHIISNPKTLFFCIENNSELITERRTTTVSSYSQLLAGRFMLLCAHVERRNHIQNELEKNAHIFKTIAEVKSFLRMRLGDSTFVVFDVATYTNHMIEQTIGTDMPTKTISSPREVTTPRIIAGRSMSF